MKLFQVIYEIDGDTRREPGKAITEINRVTLSIAAHHIDEVWNDIEWLRNDEEITVVQIAEVLPMVKILSQADTGKEQQ